MSELYTDRLRLLDMADWYRSNRVAQAHAKAQACEAGAAAIARAEAAEAEVARLRAALHGQEEAK